MVSHYPVTSFWLNRAVSMPSAAGSAAFFVRQTPSRELTSRQYGNLSSMSAAASSAKKSPNLRARPSEGRRMKPHSQNKRYRLLIMLFPDALLAS